MLKASTRNSTGHHQTRGCAIHEIVIYCNYGTGIEYRRTPSEPSPSRLLSGAVLQVESVVVVYIASLRWIDMASLIDRKCLGFRRGNTRCAAPVEWINPRTLF